LTNETIELQGNPVLETKEGPMTGDVMTYDRIRNKLNVTNPHMLIRGEAVGKTNQIALPKSAPAPQPTAP
jgi:lipopolysaccharide export system protein LptA